MSGDTRQQICVIGNSHLVAVSEAWRGMEDRKPGVGLHFFGMPGGMFGDFRCENGRLIPPTARHASFLARVADGASHVDIARYDAFLLVGLGLRYRAIAEVHETYRTIDLHEPGRTLVSDAGLAATGRAIVIESPAVRVIDQLRTVTDAPIALIAEPRPGEGIRHDRIMARRWDMTGMGTLFDRFDADIATTARTAGVDSVAPPAELLTSAGFTHDRYRDGARHLLDAKRGMKKDEYFHMNAAYGKVMLGLALDALELQLSPAV